ncbi:MAG: GrpE protein cofactor [Marmoricola sp.]|nr:GrpE protein cofactor [Marmoricola sp.]MCW2827606.1 GrpE protein cofactor [Marmoricola sp.]
MTSSPDEKPDETTASSAPQEQPRAGEEPFESPRASAAQAPRQETGAPQAGSRPGGPPEAHPDESGSFGDDAPETASATEVEDAPLTDGGLAASDELILAQTALAERTLDLQRIQAEFLNYKRRVERDRELVKQNATYSVLSGMLPVLDDIDRAREHGELEGGFKAVADSLDRTVASLGLTKFGARGDEFDPNLHEALMHGHSPDVTTTVVDVVAQAGYRIGDRVVRAAKVTVLDPEN